MADLATQLMAAGNEVTIITSKWGKEWPTHFDYHGIPVHRIARFGAGPWGSFRYARAYSRYFAQTEQFDGVIIAGLAIAPRAVVKAIGSRIKTIVYIDDQSFDSALLPEIQKRHVSIFQNATAIVTPCSQIASQFEEFINPVAIEVIPIGARITNDEPTLASQSAARAALSEAHPILAIDAGQPLVMTLMSSNRDGGIFDLIDAWSTIAESIPRAKLWIIGDGLNSTHIWKHIVRRNLVHSVIMPGYFDDLSELVLSADLYVHPTRGAFASSGLIRAMAGKCCVIASDNTWTNSLIEPNVSGMVTPAKNPKAMAEAILLGLGDPGLRARLANQAQEVVKSSHSIESQTDRYIELLFETADKICNSKS